jgi:hypothetical protein
MRHLVATIAYRSKLAFTDPPEGFADQRLTDGAMSAVELVNHMAMVLGYCRARLTQGERVAFDLTPWDEEVGRFYDVLNDIDAALASGAQLAEGEDLKMLQGPLADACTHIGQLSTLRRATGSPIAGTNFIKAEVLLGNYGI